MAERVHGDLRDRYYQRELMLQVSRSGLTMEHWTHDVGSLYTSDRLVDEQTLVWERENAALAKPKSKSAITLPEYTADDAARFDHLQSMFDNRAYQRDNYTEACGAVGILNAEHPRLPGMTRNLVFRIWQVVAIHAIMIFRQLLNGCVIADAVGLGKTWIALGCLLQVSASPKPSFIYEVNIYLALR